MHLALVSMLVLGMLLLAFVQRNNPRELQPAFYDSAYQAGLVTRRV